MSFKAVQYVYVQIMTCLKVVLATVITSMMVCLHGRVDSQVIIVNVVCLVLSSRPLNVVTSARGSASPMCQANITVESASKGQCNNACIKRGWNWFNFIEDESPNDFETGKCQLLPPKLGIPPETLLAQLLR